MSGSATKSLWRGNPLRVSPFQRELRSLPPFRGRGFSRALRPRGRLPLEPLTIGQAPIVQGF